MVQVQRKSEKAEVLDEFKNKQPNKFKNTQPKQDQPRRPRLRDGVQGAIAALADEPMRGETPAGGGIPEHDQKIAAQEQWQRRQRRPLQRLLCRPGPAEQPARCAVLEGCTDCREMPLMFPNDPRRSTWHQGTGLEGS